MNTPTLNQTSVIDLAKYTLGSVIVVGAIFTTVVMASRVMGPLPLSVNQTTTQRLASFDVSGESELITVPDQAEVSVGISARGATVAEAQAQVNGTINGITQAVKDLGVKADDIKTLDYSINPEYDYESTYRPIIAYNVNTSLRIKTDELETINQVIDTATQNGANQVNGVTFSLSKAKEDELTNTARKEAIEDARSNAQELAKLSGMRLGRIMNVYEQPPYNYQPPMPYGGGVMMARDAIQETSIQPGSTTFTYKVTLSYETL